MPRPTHPCHLFGLEGERVESFPSATACGQRIGCSVQAVFTALSRGSVLLGRYYVSRELHFVPQVKKTHSRNTLLRPHRGGRGKFAGGAGCEHVAQDLHELFSTDW